MMKSRRQFVSRAAALGGAAAILTWGLATEAPAQTTGASVLITNIEFSVGPAQGGIPGTLGLPGTDVRLEQVVPIALPQSPDSCDDDVYRAIMTHPLPYSNALIVDDGYPTVATYGVGISGGPPPPQATLPNDNHNINALSLNEASYSPGTLYEEVRSHYFLGSMFIYFSVDDTSVGLPATGVNIENSQLEHPGDVYMAMPMNNVVVADEDSLGLQTGTPNDDCDALIIQESIDDIVIEEDTDGDSTNDTKFFFFCVDAPFNAGAYQPADILAPGGGGGGIPAAAPTIIFPFVALGLQAGDDIDALFVDNTTPLPCIIFSLSRTSPSLATIPNPVTMGTGADPGDLIFVDLNQPIGPTNPVVVFTAIELGLLGDGTGGDGGPGIDDELNALWILDEDLGGALVAVELDWMVIE